MHCFLENSQPHNEGNIGYLFISRGSLLFEDKNDTQDGRPKLKWKKGRQQTFLRKPVFGVYRK